jgi:PAS domain S-box-containing protein
MQRGVAIGVALCGLALLGTAFAKPRWTLLGAAIPGILGSLALLESLFRLQLPSDVITGRMSPATAFCFILLAGGLVLAQRSQPLPGSLALGISGVLAASIGVACGISVIWGNESAFGLGRLTRMSVPSATSFLLLGLGAAVVAVDMSLTQFRLPVWAPIGATVFLATIRIGFWRTFSPKNLAPAAANLALAAALLSAMLLGLVVYLALKAGLQRELLRTTNRSLEQEMLERKRAEEAAQAGQEQLEQRVIERTSALEAVNEELRREIARREKVQDDLRQQKEILQSVFDHVPLILKFVDKHGRLQMVNREWERVLGRSYDEVVNQGVDVYVEGYPDAVERQRVLDFAANSNGEWADFKTRTKDGRIIDTSWAVGRLSDGSAVCLGKDITARKKAERELRQQKEILQTIFDHIPVMINFGDSDFKPQLANGEWEKTLGWSLEEVVRDRVDILAENYPDPEYRAQVRDFVFHSNGEWRDFKTRVRDGRVIDTSWVMLHLPDGTSIGIGQDITWRKRAEEALRESEERFRQLAENISDLFWIKTPDFKRMLYLSPAYERMSGRSREERYQENDSTSFVDRIVPEDRGKMADIIRRGVEEEFDIEFRIRHADGSIRWIHDRGFPIRDESGRIYRIAGIAQDITERKQAEQALKESEQRFRQLAENIHEVFWLRSPDFQEVLYVSPMYEKVCGRSSESLYDSGTNLVEVHPEDRPLLNEMIRSFKGNEFEIEYRIITKDGKVRWIRDRGFPIRDQHGEICRIGGVAEDITDRKEAEARLRATSDQLRALSASLQSAREQEAARIAHQIHDEMGGILTGFRWELEALEKMIHDPANPERLKVMQDKLRAMLGLTDASINVVRRIASELRPSILDDLGLMEAIEWQTQQFQARTGIQCRCQCSLQSFPLPDQQATAVFRIFQEALTNILRHAQATRVEVALHAEEEMLILTVSDNGRGITPAEKFHRGSLGLLGMRERAHLIGGHVDIEGVPGEGTTLRVRVPLEVAQAHSGAKR